MLTTVEAEIDVSGNVRLLEPVEVKQTTRAIVTLLESSNGNRGNADKVLAFLQSPEFINRKSYSAEEAEAQIQDARNSWE